MDSLAAHLGLSPVLARWIVFPAMLGLSSLVASWLLVGRRSSSGARWAFVIASVTVSVYVAAVILPDLTGTGVLLAIVAPLLVAAGAGFAYLVGSDLVATSDAGARRVAVARELRAILAADAVDRATVWRRPGSRFVVCTRGSNSANP